MKRPGPLPPRESRRDAPIDDAEIEAPGGPVRGRSRLADLVPFSGRERRDEADEHDEPDLGSGARDGWFSRLRERGRGRRLERAEVRRFTAAARRRRNRWIAGGAVVVVVVAGSVAAAYSPLFAVERILVIGAESIDASEIQGALDEQVGRAMPTVDHDEIRDDLAAFPVIETYSVEARPPHDLVIRITERTAVAVIESEAGFATVDAAGVPLATSEERPEGLPTVDAEGGPSGEAFAAVGQVLRALPDDLRARVTHAAASSPDAVSFDLSDGGGVTIMWGSPGETAEKVLTLQRAFEQRPPDTVSTYDVSSAGVLVVG